LKDNHIINPGFQDTTIIEVMENEYNANLTKEHFRGQSLSNLMISKKVSTKSYLSCLFPIRITNMSIKPGTNQKYIPAEFLISLEKI